MLLKHPWTELQVNHFLCRGERFSSEAEMTILMAKVASLTHHPPNVVIHFPPQ